MPRRPFSISMHTNKQFEPEKPSARVEGEEETVFLELYDQLAAEQFPHQEVQAPPTWAPLSHSTACHSLDSWGEQLQRWIQSSFQLKTLPGDFRKIPVSSAKITHLQCRDYYCLTLYDCCKNYSMGNNKIRKTSVILNGHWPDKKMDTLRS